MVVWLILLLATGPSLIHSLQLSDVDKSYSKVSIGEDGKTTYGEFYVDLPSKSYYKMSFQIRPNSVYQSVDEDSTEKKDLKQTVKFNQLKHRQIAFPQPRNYPDEIQNRIITPANQPNIFRSSYRIIPVPAHTDDSDDSTVADVELEDSAGASAALILDSIPLAPSQGPSLESGDAPIESDPVTIATSDEAETPPPEPADIDPVRPTGPPASLSPETTFVPAQDAPPAPTSSPVFVSDTVADNSPVEDFNAIDDSVSLLKDVALQQIEGVDTTTEIFISPDDPSLSQLNLIATDPTIDIETGYNVGGSTPASVDEPSEVTTLPAEPEETTARARLSPTAPPASVSSLPSLYSPSFHPYNRHYSPSPAPYFLSPSTYAPLFYSPTTYSPPHYSPTTYQPNHYFASPTPHSPATYPPHRHSPSVYPGSPPLLHPSPPPYNLYYPSNHYDPTTLQPYSTTPASTTSQPAELETPTGPEKKPLTIKYRLLSSPLAYNSLNAPAWNNQIASSGYRQISNTTNYYEQQQSATDNIPTKQHRTLAAHEEPGHESPVPNPDQSYKTVNQIEPQQRPKKYTFKLLSPSTPELPRQLGTGILSDIAESVDGDSTPAKNIEPTTTPPSTTPSASAVEESATETATQSPEFSQEFQQVEPTQPVDSGLVEAGLEDDLAERIIPLVNGGPLFRQSSPAGHGNTISPAEENTAPATLPTEFSLEETLLGRPKSLYNPRRRRRPISRFVRKIVKVPESWRHRKTESLLQKN